MDATHLHLMLNHFPIIGVIIGIGILVYGQYSKNEAIIKVALTTFIIMAILTIPVFLSGEEAEETVEQLAEVSESFIEEHEELAEKAIWLMGLLGVISLVNFYVFIKKIPSVSKITIATLVVSLATFGLFAKVGDLGGEIRHTEIREAHGHGAISPEKNNHTATPQHEEDDDD